MGVQNGSQTMWDSFQTSALMLKTCLSHLFRTLVAYAGSCLRMHASDLRTRICVCERRQRVSLTFIFQK